MLVLQDARAHDSSISTARLLLLLTVVAHAGETLAHASTHAQTHKLARTRIPPHNHTHPRTRARTHTRKRVYAYGPPPHVLLVRPVVEDARFGRVGSGASARKPPSMVQ